MNLIKTLLLPATLLGASLIGANAAVITGFGSSEFSITYNDFTSAPQTGDSLRLIGNDFGSSVYGSLAIPFEIIGSLDSISLNGSYSGTSEARFDIALIDADGDSLNYTGYLSSFTQGVTSSVTLSFGFSEGVFNGPVRSAAIITNGIGDGVDLTVHNVEAIPEPSTIALMALGTAGAVLFIRRRKNA